MKHLSAGPGTYLCACFTCGTHRYSNVLKKVINVLHSFMICSQWKHLHFCQISTQTYMQKIQSYFICDHWEYDILKCGKRGIEKYKKKLKLWSHTWSVQSGRQGNRNKCFKRTRLLPSSSTLKMEISGSYKTSVSKWKTTECYVP